MFDKTKTGGWKHNFLCKQVSCAYAKFLNKDSVVLVKSSMGSPYVRIFLLIISLHPPPSPLCQVLIKYVPKALNKIFLTCYYTCEFCNSQISITRNNYLTSLHSPNKIFPLRKAKESFTHEGTGPM